MNTFKEYKVVSRVRRKTNLKKIVILLLIVAVAQFAAVECLLAFNSGSDRERATDYLVILGAGLEGETPSLILKERLAAGLRYLEKYPGTRVVVSGGQGRGEDITEAEAMRRYLVSNGIEESRILVEDRSTSTMENFKYSKSLIEQKSGKPVPEITFITSNFHILRAKMLADRNNLQSFAISCKTPAGMVIPLYLREYMAFFKSLAVDR